MSWFHLNSQPNLILRSYSVIVTAWPWEVQVRDYLQPYKPLDERAMDYAYASLRFLLKESLAIRGHTEDEENLSHALLDKERLCRTT